MRMLNFIKLLVIPFMIYSGCVFSSDHSVVEMVAGNDASELETIFQNLTVKHEREISTLGLSEEQLNSIVYARPSWVHNFGRLFTIREFVGILFGLPNLQYIKLSHDGKYIGFKIKVRGAPSTGFALYQDDNEYFLKGLVDDDGIMPTDNAKDDARLFSYYYSTAVGVAIRNGFKG